MTDTENDEPEDDTPKCVHTEHCCYEHGCKYGNDACPVENGFLPASFPCESCDFKRGYRHDYYDDNDDYNRNYWYSDEDELE